MMARSRREAREIEATWKWVNREWQRRIVPLFHRQTAPEPNAESIAFVGNRRRCSKPGLGRTDFLRPWHVLTAARARRNELKPRIGAPSIENFDSLGALIKEAGLSRELSILWDGHALYIERKDGKRVQIKSKTLGTHARWLFVEAVEALTNPSRRKEVQERLGLS